jgi:hypothetical protein
MSARFRFSSDFRNRRPRIRAMFRAGQFARRSRCLQCRDIGRTASSGTSSANTRENHRKYPLFTCHDRQQGPGNRPAYQGVYRALGSTEDSLFLRARPGSNPFHGSLAPFPKQIHREVVPLATQGTPGTTNGRDELLLIRAWSAAQLMTSRLSSEPPWIRG